ncbi:hypothetical protein [Brevundimonas sp.]|uniref:hypothetical protein n=1 Tax=Brevundimonas sp. TaxID=1871086 RepID=UPI002D59C1B4|nr:hypothetical protein [Brevundimonas sp.]HYC74525.1 hypothetical protein [Brevundimonas sp.]
MSVDIKLERGLRRVWLTVLAEPPKARVAETAVQLVKQHPGVAGWDWIIDLRVSHAKATPEEMDSIFSAFSAKGQEGNCTIFISNDSSAYDLCALLGRKFPHRRYLAARSRAEAEALLPQRTQGI